MRRHHGLFDTQQYMQPRHFIHQDSRRPLITYGKANTKPISLNADQFRTCTYDLSSDDNDDAQQAVQPVLQAADRETEASQDSVLSGAELQHSPSRRLQRDEEPAAVVSPRPGSSEENERASRVVKSDKTASKQHHPSAKVAKPKSKANGSTKTATKASKRKAVASRVVPANELHLVPSHTVNVPRKALASSYVGVAWEDPIVDSSIAPCRRAISPAPEDDGPPTKKLTRTPVGVLRTRWKAPPSRFKSLRRGDKLPVTGVDLSGRDGFEKCEMRLDSGKKRRTERLVKTPSVPHLTTLDLTSGPLPDVDFHDSAVELEMVTKVVDEGTPPSAQQQHDGVVFEQTESPMQRSRRRTSSVLRIREEMIMSELSSVRASERTPSGSEQTDETEDVEYHCDIADHDVRKVIQQHQNQHQNSRASNSPHQPPTSNQGVSLDFHRPGQIRPSARSSMARRPVLMEVDETIMDVLSPVPQRNYHPSTNHHQPDLSVRMLEQTPVTGHTAARQPRSILKNSTPIVPALTTALEVTAANTRRNSTILASRSGYFSEAADTLRAPDPARHIIMPRRQSSYFDDEQLQVFRTDGWLPETSLEPINYVAESELNVLRRSADGVWTSGLPRVERDLGTLTRTVSQEFGTLSQAVRRRPSLSFRSPTKVR